MNNNQVKNEQTKVPQTKEMNDKDRLTDVLTTLKNITNNYSTFLNEASNDHLYEESIRLFKDTQDSQREIFNLLFKKGWYVLERADQTKITTKYNEYSGKTNELP
ncbi:MAG: spore coat protein [Bacilli bacterium]